MILYIGADHRGFKLKEFLKRALEESGYEVVDLGNKYYDENDDYPDFAAAVAFKISLDYENSRGILICGSGVGMDIVANKFLNVRSVLAFSPDQAFDSRNDDNTNVLCLAADFISNDQALKIVYTWLQTPFADDDKFIRRLQKISKLESKNFRPVQEDEQNEEQQWR
jgi:ribose 5-phosphate isomerase B